MCEVDSSVVSRVASQIMQSEEFTPESAEKKLRDDRELMNVFVVAYRCTRLSMISAT